MIDHVGFPVSDCEWSKAFHAAALAPLGFWIGAEGGLERPLHVAIACDDRDGHSIEAVCHRPA